MLARFILPLSLAGLIGIAFWVGGAAPRDAAADAPVAEANAWKPQTVEVRGVAMQVQTNYKVLDTFVPQLREIAALGANTVLFCPAGFMEHAKAEAIFIDMRKTPTPQEFETLIREARKLKLQVNVMPLVLLSHPRGSEWRGQIEPPDWDDWWKQYREFILYFTDIAAAGGADSLMVGSELVSTERNRDEWVKLIGEIRTRFPGKLGYSANWDHYRPVSFWDKLDFAGMTSYYTLADKDLPSVDEIADKWRPIHKKIFEFQKDIGKPLVLTEVGWCSQKGAARAPWDYYRNQVASPDGLEEQRRLYEAFLKVFDGTPGLAGVVWWEWASGEVGSGDYGYCPKGKPAEKVLKDWFAKYNKDVARAEAAAEKAPAQ